MRVEENGAVPDENIQFANIIDECGKVLITKGNMLLHLGTKIQKICDNYSNKFPPLPTRKKHEHTVIIWQPPKPTEDVVIDSDLILTQQNPDDERNTYHDPGKFPPMTVKQGFPDCSSAEEEEEEENVNLNEDQSDSWKMHASPIQSRKKKCVKGLHVCQLCGKDYINKLDLNSHLIAHAGVTFNCERCGQ